MKSYRNSDTVLDELGDKFTSALVEAVAAARRDLAEYRLTSPHFVADSSKRGLANWIHDRLWHHLVTLLDDVAGVFFVERGVTREICVGANYRVRLKRHHAKAEVSTYPTPTALEFLSQPPASPTLPGFDEVHLIAGYRWLESAHDVGPAVISLRDGKDNVLWIVELPDGDVPSEVEALPERPAPAPPRVQDPHGAKTAETMATNDR